MSNINEMVFLEQVTKQTFLDQKIKNIQNQNSHLSQLMPFHKQNVQNTKNTESSNKKPEKKDPPKIFELPTRKELKMAKHFEKMASRLTDFSKPLI